MKAFNKSIKIIVLSLGIMLVQQLSCSAQTTNHKAYALFLYNFTKHTNWSAASNNNKIVITVLGKSNTTDFLKQLSQQKKLKGKEYAIRQVGSVDEIPETSDLVYVTALRSGALKSINEKFQGRQTLIVTERDGLIRKGAHISFVVLDNGSLRFQLNREALLDNGLQLSSSLVNMAYRN